MSFSDEDLKKLKIRMIYNHSEGYKQTTLKVSEVDSILGRLEAAEKAAQFMFISKHPIDESAQEAYEAWLRSAGKSR